LKRAFLRWDKARSTDPNFDLKMCQVGWRTGNPYFVWKAIDICGSRSQKLPTWVYDYLVAAAGRMMLPETAEAGDLREILPLVLGFRGKRGPGGHPLRPNGARDPNTDYLTLAMAFAAEIQKGAVLKTDVKPSEALTRALMSAESKLVYRDHKTLMINVAKEFG